MPKATILVYDKLPAMERGGGMSTKPLAGKHNGALGISTGISTFPPGTIIPMHLHNVEESVVLLEGEAMFDSEGKSTPMKPYDTTHVPAGVPHRFRNVGKGIMRTLWIYGGTHVTRTNLETGETQVHMSADDNNVGRKA